MYMMNLGWPYSCDFRLHVLVLSALLWFTFKLSEIYDLDWTMFAYIPKWQIQAEITTCKVATKHKDQMVKTANAVCLGLC